MRAFRDVVISTLLAAVASSPAAAETIDITGPAVVIDGDSLEVAGAALRLEGVDACELDQWATLDGQPWPCGEVARAWLAGLTAGLEVRCRGDRRDAYGRGLVRCSVNGRDVGRRGIADGVYVAYRYRGRLTVPAYGPVEAVARTAGIGLWASDFEMPWDWRRQRR